jgi:CRP-like cAMP-binding protein
VLSHAGKEAVVAVLDGGHFFGEGCLAGQAYRMATALAMASCTIIVVEKSSMVRRLRSQPAFAERFLTHMLTMNKFRKLGFIEHNGGLKINNSLLSVVLRD